MLLVAEGRLTGLHSHPHHTCGSTLASRVRGMTLRSARLQMALAWCRNADMQPPEGRMKLRSTGSCLSSSSIHACDG